MKSPDFSAIIRGNDDFISSFISLTEEACGVKQTRCTIYIAICALAGSSLLTILTLLIGVGIYLCCICRRRHRHRRGEFELQINAMEDGRGTSTMGEPREQ